MRATLLLTFAIFSLTASAANAGVAYTYDGLGRLWTASYDNGKQIVYTYDPAGNRTQVVTQATPPHMALIKTKPKPQARKSPKRAR